MATYKRADGVITATVGDDFVLLNPSTEVFFSINDTGTRVWNLLESPRTVQELASALSVEYEVDPQRCQTSVVSFLDDATRHGVVESF